VNWIVDLRQKWRTLFNESLNALKQRPSESSKTSEAVAQPTPPKEISTSLGRWEQALVDATPAGARAKTCVAERCAAVGAAASQKIAQRDMEDARRLKDVFDKAATETAPAAVLMGIASRESHFGKSLTDGWGDRHHAFGMMQIDARYHKLATYGGPEGIGNVQAAEKIFSGYLKSVIENHPLWDDKYLLEGALVAYNSGVENVQTIEGMNKGTTGKDYGSDALARSQEFYKQLYAGEQK
jgi:Transglycosylase SLT domain